jgi:hypothetical protein
MASGPDPEETVAETPTPEEFTESEGSADAGAGSLPSEALDSANDADLLEQSIPVPFDEEDR